MSDQPQSLKIRRYVFRFGGEAVLIVASVFVAILLESMWQNHAEAKEARESLAQVRRSLAEDKAFLDRVEDEQKAAEELIQLLIRWVEQPDSLSDQQVTGLFVNYSMPISIWPRRAAWDSMVSAGQLRLLGAPDLTTSIGDYYEYHLSRVEYNSRQYDDLFVAIFEGDIPTIWNFEEGRLLSTNPSDLVRLRNRLVQLRSWNEYYLNYVRTNRGLLEELINEIDTFLHQGSSA